VQAEEKWPFEHSENVPFCNSVSKHKQAEEDEIVIVPHVSPDHNLTVSISFILERFVVHRYCLLFYTLMYMSHKKKNSNEKSNFPWAFDI